MIKILSILLSLVLLVSAVMFSLSGCEGNKEENSEVNREEIICGGWSMANKFETPTIPEDAKSALDKATKEIKDETYEVVAYLGSQVVAGMNYAYLCNITPANDNAKSRLNVVIVYKDLEGNVSVTNTKEIDITAYTSESAINYEELAGGWESSEAVGGKLSEDTQKAFDKAVDGLSGVTYEPVSLLGSQVVAGTNYAILCKATSVTENPATKLAVLVIYADLEDNAEVSTICGFDIY